MRFPDLLRLAWDNLRRNTTRTLLTGVGVAIGVAALLALLAYGTGLQQTVEREFDTLELYNTLRITSQPNPIEGFSDLAFREQPSEAEADTLPDTPITDSLLAVIEDLDGVLAAYPEITFPTQVGINDRLVVASAEAVPMAFGNLEAYQPITGSFFTTAQDSALLLSPSMATRLGYDEPEAIVGETVTLTTATLDAQRMVQAGAALFAGGTLPLREEQHPLRVAGLLEDQEQAFTGFTRVVLPLELAQQLEQITFFSTLDLLLRGGDMEGYAAGRVQLRQPDALPEVRDRIEAMGAYVTSFRDQFAQLDRLFVIVDLALGIIGFIALLVATIGIANTMLMNVMERTREIGVMKAVGGDERDLQRLFVVESALVGVLGGLAGLFFGWLVTAGLQLGIDQYLRDIGVPPIEVFVITPVMVAGVLGVALAVSLLAGVVPARRAARIEPMEALRSG